VEEKITSVVLDRDANRHIQAIIVLTLDTMAVAAVPSLQGIARGQTLTNAVLKELRTITVGWKLC
jgi:hypothetical protein